MDPRSDSFCEHRSARRRPPARALLALGVALVLAGCGGDGGGSAAPTAAATPASPAPVVPEPASAAPTAEPGQGSKGGVVLGGEDLGVTRLGAPFREAVAAVSEVLGQPDEDPSQTVSCIQATTEVRWGELVLAAQDDRLAGWSSQSQTVQTPSGVAVGTPLPEMVELYGPSLERFPADPDNPPTFAVQGVDVRGDLSSAEDDASVTRLYSSFCAGP